MFDSLALENPKRKWATMMSFTLETALLGMLVVAPLAFTDSLPSLRFGETLIAPTGGPPPTTEQVPEQKPTASITTEIKEGRLIAPGKIPDRIAVLNESQTRGGSDPSSWVIGAPQNDRTNSLVQSLVREVTPIVTGPTREPATRISISHIDPWFLISRVQPIYPKLAITTHTEGTVVLAALIDTTGRITQLHAISGHPLLVPAAIDAVRQWRYKPYLLNGSPVEVETQVSVIFNLNR